MSAPHSCPPLEDPAIPEDLPPPPRRVGGAFPDPAPRGDRLLRLLERPFLALDHALAALPEAWNPLSRAGAIANTSLLIAVVTGVVLLLWYVPSVHEAWNSVTAMGGRSLAGLTRSLHRYSSDAAIFFVLVHALRLAAERRFGGPRWLAWITGLVLLGSLWAVGWSGYWLVWDERAELVARGTARMVDLLPIFSEPLSRSFLVDENVNSLLFFVVFFLHMLLPLGAAIALWLHITRLSRPRFLTDGPLTVWVVASLTLLSLILPADVAAEAQMTVFARPFAMDAWYLLPLWLTERLSGGALWALVLVGGIALGAVPWALTRGRATPAVVDPARCNACETCFKDCPYDAIQMVPRADARPFPSVALVDPDKCVGCGVCVGSCDTLAIGPSTLPAMPVRRAVGRQSAEAKEAGAPEWFLFACARSAAEKLEFDASTGRSEALPGWRVVALPCAGWLHPWVIGRALKGGAAGAVVLSCTPSSCAWREGESWTAERLAGLREPELDQGLRDRVHLLRLDLGQAGELVGRLAKIRAGAGRQVGAPRRRAVGLVATAALLALLGVGSALPYAPLAQEPSLVLSFVHPGQVAEDCHTLTAEEKAKLPPHMQRDEICERRRADVRLRVTVDGEQRLLRTFAPHGIWGDGSSVALERVPLAPGRHEVRVEIADGLEADLWQHVELATVEATPERDLVLLFSRNEGFRWY